MTRSAAPPTADPVERVADLIREVGIAAENARRYRFVPDPAAWLPRRGSPPVPPVPAAVPAAADAGPALPAGFPYIPNIEKRNVTLTLDDDPRSWDSARAARFVRLLLGLNCFERVLR